MTSPLSMLPTVGEGALIAATMLVPIPNQLNSDADHGLDFRPGVVGPASNP